MALKLVNLDERTRRFMVSEIESDKAADKLYESPRLNERGREKYYGLLREAAAEHDASWLAERLRRDGLMKSVEERKNPKGGTTTAQVPVNAPDTLAEGEFNRFYIRGLCLRAIEDKIPELIIYRAKEVGSPRSESEAKIGERIDPQQLLDDVRKHPGVDTALGLPPGPNSGLSAQLPEKESVAGLSVRYP
jgi:hypothetical protein